MDVVDGDLRRRESFLAGRFEASNSVSSAALEGWANPRSPYWSELRGPSGVRAKCRCGADWRVAPPVLEAKVQHAIWAGARSTLIPGAVR